MTENIEKTGLPRLMLTSLRCWAATLAVCCVCYTAAILAIGQIFVPYTANGSLIKNENGEIIGSEMLAQKFEKPEYFHPRPSAVDYNAMGAAGSNLSPTSPSVRERAAGIIEKESTFTQERVPADMLTASGSGLDPHITVKAAVFQADRVAKARNLPAEEVKKLIEKHAVKTGGFFTPEPLVNVLVLNIALDKTGEKQ